MKKKRFPEPEYAKCMHIHCTTETRFGVCTDCITGCGYEEQPESTAPVIPQMDVNGLLKVRLCDCDACKDQMPLREFLDQGYKVVIEK